MSRLSMKCAAIAAVMSLAAPAYVLAAQDNLENLMWELVSSSNDITSVEAFIERYPDSPRIDEARATLAKLRQKDSAQSMEDEIFRSVGAVTYTSPLAFGNEHLIGRSLSQIIDSHPEYPPVAGLPEEMWKEESCRSCHNWTRDNLCVQANNYVAMDPDKYRQKKHPFGGLLKINLRNWAQNDCQ